MTEKKEDRKTRIEILAETLNEGFWEREEHVAVALLAALSGQNIFLLGPPGTAKSMLARRLKSAFKGDNDNKIAYFEYLMQRFSTPEEIFGPVSIEQLKQDNYVRKTEGFLPTTEIAFLDEIWKSNPSILNTLLTIINEKTFRNGTEIKRVPLKALIAASNETPPDGQGLEALYDRFGVRLYVPPMEKTENFENLLKEGPADSNAECDDMAITTEELEKWKEQIHKITLSDETIRIIKAIRLQLNPKSKAKKINVYVSDRRWQKAAILLKAAAFFCGREETNLTDTLLLRHCLWTTEKNREEVINIVEEEVRNCGFKTELSSEHITERKNNLQKEIKKELFYTKDIYETTTLEGQKEEYFKFTVGLGYSDSHEPHDEIEFYVPVKLMRSEENFSPVDESGNEIEYLTYNFNKQDTISLEHDSHHYRLSQKDDNGKWGKFSESLIYNPEIQFSKGSRKKTNPRLTNAFSDAVIKIGDELDSVISEIKKKRDSFWKEIETPFIPNEVLERSALQGIEEQLKRIRAERESCNLLLATVEGKKSG